MVKIHNCALLLDLLPFLGYTTRMSLFSRISPACVPKIMIRWWTVPEIWCAMDRQTDRQTDRSTDGWTDRKKWHIELGAPPKKVLEAKFSLYWLWDEMVMNCFHIINLSERLLWHLLLLWEWRNFPSSRP